MLSNSPEFCVEVVDARVIKRVSALLQPAKQTNRTEKRNTITVLIIKISNKLALIFTDNLATV